MIAENNKNISEKEEKMFEKMHNKTCIPFLKLILEKMIGVKNIADEFVIGVDADA